MLKAADRVLILAVMAVAAQRGTMAMADGVAGVTCPAGQTLDSIKGVCVLAITVGGNSGGAPAQTRHDRTRAGRSSAPAACVMELPKAEKVPCTSLEGYWSNERQCYVSLAAPQPVKSELIWEGHSDGAIYECHFDRTKLAAGLGHTYSFWAAAQPPGVVPPPDPAVLAKRLVSRMGFRAVTIGMVPENRAGALGTVGLPVWMWVADPSPQTFGPQTDSLSERGVSVTAVARVNRVVWEMGDGQAVTCVTAGTEFRSGDGGRPSPDCGYTYQQQGTFTIRARSHWDVEWTSNTGQAGSIPMDYTASRVLEVGEVQVVRK